MRCLAEISNFLQQKIQHLSKKKRQKKEKKRKNWLPRTRWYACEFTVLKTIANEPTILSKAPPTEQSLETSGIWRKLLSISLNHANNTSIRLTQINSVFFFFCFWAKIISIHWISHTRICGLKFKCSILYLCRSWGLDNLVVYKCIFQTYKLYCIIYRFLISILSCLINKFSSWALCCRCKFANSSLILRQSFRSSYDILFTIISFSFKKKHVVYSHSDVQKHISYKNELLNFRVQDRCCMDPGQNRSPYPARPANEGWFFQRSGPANKRLFFQRVGKKIEKRKKNEFSNGQAGSAKTTKFPNRRIKY